MPPGDSISAVQHVKLKSQDKLSSLLSRAEVTDREERTLRDERAETGESLSLASCKLALILLTGSGAPPWVPSTRTGKCSHHEELAAPALLLVQMHLANWLAIGTGPMQQAIGASQASACFESPLLASHA